MKKQTVYIPVQGEAEFGVYKFDENGEHLICKCNAEQLENVYVFTEEEYKKLTTPAPIDSKEGAEGLIKELVELKKYHINPYNLGDMGRVGEIINALEKTITYE